MTDRPMKFLEEIPMRGTDRGWKLFVVEQVTNAAVADNDTLTFPNVKITDIRIVSMVGSTGQVMNFDTLAAESTVNARFTVDHPDTASSKHNFGTLADGGITTSCSGLVLVRNRS